MELRLYWRMLQRGWWIVLLTALVAVNVALVLSYFATPMYQASARFSVSPNTTLVTGTEVVTSLEALDKRSIVQTYAEFLNSPRIYTETLKAMQLDPQKMVNYTLSTVVLPDANILELSVQGPDPQLTAALANQVGARAIEYIKKLYQVYDINLLDPAVVPAAPYSPQPLRNAGLALALGLVVGAGLAIVREQIRIPLESYRMRMSVDSDSMAFNRAYFLRRTEDELARNPSGNISLGLVQLNGLRGLIEALPHAMLQDLLRRVNSILQKELRGNDIICRWNDVSFAMMLPSTPKTAAALTLERIRQALSKPIELEMYGETLYLNPNVSVATHQENETISELIESAEHELERTRI